MIEEESGNLFRPKIQIGSLFPSLELYYGKSPIRLLSFFNKILEAFRAFDSAEGVAIRVLSY